VSGLHGTGKAVILLAVGAAVALGGESPSAMPYDRLLRANYGPLEDPHLGLLCEAATQLLEATRSLPEQIEIRLPVATPAPPAAEPEVPMPAAPAPVQAQTESEETQWPAVLERPILDKEELAHAFFLAGSYEKAAALYRDLREEHADDAHFLFMLLLCERNAGHDTEAASLLADWRETGPEAAEWADWLAALTALNAEVAKENQ
jgi:hypothetical protein